MARSDPQVNIRMPQELKDRLEAATAVTNRSLNGEILERLQQSFDGPMKQSEVEELLKKLSERDDKDRQNAARNHLLSLSAMFMRLVVERLPEGKDELADEMLNLVLHYSDNIVHGNFERAIGDAVSLVDRGISFGVLSEEAARHAESIREPEHRGRRRSPIYFPQAFEAASPPAGKKPPKK